MNAKTTPFAQKPSQQLGRGVLPPLHEPARKDTRVLRDAPLHPHVPLARALVMSLRAGAGVSLPPSLPLVPFPGVHSSLLTSMIVSPVSRTPVASQCLQNKAQTPSFQDPSLGHSRVICSLPARTQCWSQQSISGSLKDLVTGFLPPTPFPETGILSLPHLPKATSSVKPSQAPSTAGAIPLPPNRVCVFKYAQHKIYSFSHF